MSPHLELSQDSGDDHSEPSLSMASSLSEQPSRTKPSRYLPSASPDSELDLICVGFGPASLAIAVALHDALAAGQTLLPDGSTPKVLFVEKQPRFAWHAGMLLPGAKMQISFIKDLATLRDPRSEFTFLNYLHRNGRLVDFTNLSTFLPARVEYEDYLRWSAGHFNHLVGYSQEVTSVTPEAAAGSGTVRIFTVHSRNIETGQTHSYRARNVLLATGGQPHFPDIFPDPRKHARIIHSSQYAHAMPRLLPKMRSPYRVAVVGAGQSAAEIFHNIHKLYPNSRTHLIMRQGFLRPSDDSPFVNAVFNPEYIDTIFSRSARHRSKFLAEARATNYGVARLELIEELYETMYHQRRELGPDEREWPHRILGQTQIVSISPSGEALVLKVRPIADSDPDEFVEIGNEDDDEDVETLEVDLLIAATGYQRNAHVEMLKDTWEMLPRTSSGGQDFAHGVAGWTVATRQCEQRKMAVGRDYRVEFAPGAVAQGSGIWLQGCCEGTHGLSDTLLSVLATRSGEIVESIFSARR